MLLTRVPAPGGALPFVLADLKAHLRVESSDDDAAITAQGRMAALELETFASIALLTQTIRVTIFDPDPTASFVALPVGPVLAGATATVLADGDPFTDFTLLSGPKPFITFGRAMDELRPARLSIEYAAGFGPTAASIPADLALAVADGACAVYDIRGVEPKAGPARSPHLARVAARYRGVAA